MIGGSHPFLDPSGYRADLIFQLANQLYHVPNLYDLLLGHYSINKTTDALGKTYDYQFIYEHSALAAYNADATKSYRYAELPDDVDLSNPQLNRRYRKAAITIPGLGLPDTDETVSIPGTRVVWGLTVLKSAANPVDALSFLQLLFSAQGSRCRQRQGRPQSARRSSAPRISHAFPILCGRWCGSNAETTADRPAPPSGVNQLEIE